MNINLLQEKLIRAARRHPPSEHVPYAFEQRIMARLRSAGPALDRLTLWTRALWRAAIPCVVVTLLIIVWPGLSPDTSAPAVETADLGTSLESTLMASVSIENDLAW